MPASALFFGSDTTDMLVRNSGTGGFEVYDISNNWITNAAFLGTIGLDREVQGFAISAAILAKAT